MPTRREVIKGAAGGGLVLVAPGKGWGSQRSARVDNSVLHHRSSGSLIKSVVRRDDTMLRYGGNGDNWHMTWAGDDRQYVGLCDGAGFTPNPKTSYNSRVLAITGGPQDAKFYDLPGYPLLGAPVQWRNDVRYYGFGTLAVDGYLYQFLSTFNRPLQFEEIETSNPQDALRFIGAKLIYSPDGGRTWYNQNGTTPVVWESWEQRSRETLTFFEEDQESFSLLSILQMGKNYQYNKDGYIYVYSPNGNKDGLMNELVMFRSHKKGMLNRASYEYFAGFDSKGKPRWSKEIEERAAVHTFPRGWVNSLVHPYAWHPSVIYNAPLGLYLMANWGMGTASDGMWFAKPSYLGFWVARQPWGPWTQIHEEAAWLPGRDPAARAYQPQISPKWVAPDGKSVWIVWTDYQERDAETYRKFFDTEVKEKYWRNRMTDEDWRRLVAMRRKHMPYYDFNVQRVDLVMG